MAMMMPDLGTVNFELEHQSEAGDCAFCGNQQILWVGSIMTTFGFKVFGRHNQLLQIRTATRAPEMIENSKGQLFHRRPR